MSFHLSPSVDRNKMFLIRRSELEGVWNAEFYSPFFLENRSKLKNNPYGIIKLGNITSKITKGETPLWKGDFYQDEGVIFIKSENILENQLDISNHNRISNLVHTRMERSQLQENDVLFNIVGASIGRACVYPFKEEANINQAVCLIRINKDFYPDWLAITLNSRPYQIYINQLKSGGARDNIDLHQVNSFELPNHPICIQEQIIAKMDAAYATKKQKEAEAQRSLNSIDDYLLNELGINLSEPEERTIQNRIFYRNLSDITGGRFDPELALYNQEIFDSNFETKQLKQLLLISPQYGANEPGILREERDIPRYIRITDINDMGDLIEGLGVTATVIEDQYILNNNDLLIARSGNTVGKSYLHKTENVDYECFYAGYMIRFIIDLDKALPDYIFYYLQAKPYKQWVKAVQRITGQPNINAEEYKSLVIPIPPLEKQLRIVDRITAIRTQAKQLRQVAAAELEQAKQEVEAMILGERCNKA